MVTHSRSYEELRFRLARGAALLERLDRRRRESGDPYLGSNIERLIIQRELDDLAREIHANRQPHLGARHR